MMKYRELHTKRDETQLLMWRKTMIFSPPDGLQLIHYASTDS